MLKKLEGELWLLYSVATQAAERAALEILTSSIMPLARVLFTPPAPMYLVPFADACGPWLVTNEAAGAPSK